MIVDVTDFGADPTGQADSLPAFSAAMAALRAAGGGTLTGPAGEYTWLSWEHRHRSILVDVPVHWVFPGRDVARIRVLGYNDPSQRAIVVTSCTGVSFSGFELDYMRPLVGAKQAHCLMAYGSVQDLHVSGLRLISGSGDGVYLGSDVQGVEITDLEGDAQRGIITVAGNSVGRWRVGYRIVGVTHVDRGVERPGKFNVVNFERSDKSTDTFWGVEIADIHAPTANISVAACIGAIVRQATIAQLWYHLGRTTLVDCHLQGAVGPAGDGDGFTLLANGPGELRVIGGSLRVPEGGAGLVYCRILGDGPRSVEGYGVDIDIAPGATLHHFSQWAGSKWYDLTEVIP